MFPWVKIVKKTPPTPALTTMITPVPDDSMAVDTTPSPDMTSPAAPETSTISSPTNNSTIPLTKRQIKNQRRKENRQKRREMFKSSGAVLYKSAKRLETRARCQQNRANKWFKYGLIHAKNAASYSALTKEEFQPYFGDAESSLAHRDKNFSREKSRECFEAARGGTVLALRLKEAAKAAREKDLNPVDPSFKINTIENNLHKSYFK